MDLDATAFEESLLDFETKTSEDDKKLNCVLLNLEKEFLNLENCVNAHRAQVKEYARLGSLVQELEDNEKHHQMETISSEGRQIPNFQAMKTRFHLAWMAQSEIGEKIRDEHGSVFLRFILGKVNVRVWKQKDKEVMKDQYNKFKWRTSLVFVLFPLIQILYECGHTLRTLHYLWMLYYYASLALRENILNVNGSQIQCWWIYHHYISILIAGITMSIPDEMMVSIMHNGVLKFFVLQGVVMFLQNWYQSRRQYARVATGKASSIDIAASETLVENPSNLFLLVPLLYLTYVLELMAGVVLVGYSSIQRRFSWQLLIVGILWMTIGAGNASTVICVVRRKRILESQKLFSKEERKSPFLRE
uniref:Transmembrane protein 120 homolog n=1 Tax=Hirondellea gigas TaxID=1518452 RepID=A0A6A7G6G1_9CRUS